MSRWARIAVTWGRGLGLNALATLPAIAAVRSWLCCPAEWWWPGNTKPWWLSIPEGLVALLAMDFALTTIHVWWHGPLARLHAYGPHHTISEAEVDYTVGQVFGPWEPLMGVPTVWTVILVLGIPLAPAIFATSTMLLFALWAHTNWWPQWYRHLDPVFITPISHRVHHSADPAMYRCNCGFVFSFWDRLLGTRAKTAGKATV